MWDFSVPTFNLLDEDDGCTYVASHNEVSFLFNLLVFFTSCYFGNSLLICLFMFLRVSVVQTSAMLTLMLKTMTKLLFMIRHPRHVHMWSAIAPLMLSLWVHLILLVI
jgi:hypothetical protein